MGFLFVSVRNDSPLPEMGTAMFRTNTTYASKGHAAKKVKMLGAGQTFGVPNIQAARAPWFTQGF